VAHQELHRPGVVGPEGAGRGHGLVDDLPGVPAVQEQDLDHGPGPLPLAPPHLELPPERVVVGGERPPFPLLMQRKGAGEGPGALVQELQVVVEFQALGVAEVQPGMAGHHGPLVGDLHLERGDPDVDGPPHQAHRHRVPVGSAGHPGLLVHPGPGDLGHVERLGREGEQETLLPGRGLRHRHAVR
jgi:hypothetical protein